MGCFSFICQVCGQPILSNSFRGERVRLFLLENGKIIEEMEGEYDSYGRVFDDNSESIKWTNEWNKVCDLMFNPKKENGIAAIHTKCSKTLIPTVKSNSDPNQGWDKNWETHADDWIPLK